jgi:phosphoribosylformylglycinamidine synthase
VSEPEITQELIADLGLSEQEYKKLCNLLGRKPNYTELGLFSAMWSEHCSYKNSKPVLKLFPTEGKRVLQGPGENAGIVDIGDGLAIAMKIESHNHPSAIEPYEASATGAGGVIRDIFTMGARPVALLNSLRFGSLHESNVQYLFKEVARGFSSYANRVGLPVVGGEVYFDPSYEGNPLVNAMCVGVVKHTNIVKAKARGVGNSVMIVGGATGRDGVAGASFASAQLDEESAQKRSAVAIGDPQLGRVLREACLELIAKGLVLSIQDMGAAGLVCSTSEMASRGGTGIEVDISLVPKSEDGMIPYEVMLSESQERMLVIVEKGEVSEAKEVLARWDVPASVIGEVTVDGILRVKEAGKIVAEVPARALVDQAPVYHRQTRPPDYLKKTQELEIMDLKEPQDYNPILLELIGSPSIASKEWLYKHGDPKVSGDVLVSPGSDASVLRIQGTRKAIALTCDCNARYCYLDPYVGGAIAVAEACRNLVCSGARPLAVTDCLNFGNPMRPEIFWQFRRCVEGISEACRMFDTPVISGNVSFYNESPLGAVDPTPTIGMVGLIEDFDRYYTQWFEAEGDLICLLGENREELGGSEYLALIHNLKEGVPPELDLDLERRVHSAVLKAIQAGLINSAHDCAEGGLAIALAECCVSNPKKILGARINTVTQMRPDVLLFGESQSRILVSCNPRNLSQIEEVAKAENAPFEVLGRVEGEGLLIDVNDKRVVALGLEQIEQRWAGAIPRYM